MFFLFLYLSILLEVCQFPSPPTLRRISFHFINFSLLFLFAIILISALYYFLSVYFEFTFPFILYFLEVGAHIIDLRPFLTFFSSVSSSIKFPLVTALTAVLNFDTLHFHFHFALFIFFSTYLFIYLIEVELTYDSSIISFEISSLAHGLYLVVCRYIFKCGRFTNF